MLEAAALRALGSLELEGLSRSSPVLPLMLLYEEAEEDEDTAKWS
jgi:hypothetical protein